MRHTVTENKHTLVLNENEWHGLRCILDGYNEAFAGLEFDDEDGQKTAKRLFKLFDIECLIDDYDGNEY